MKRGIEVRVGVTSLHGIIARVAMSLTGRDRRPAPLLISASLLWDRKCSVFRPPPARWAEADLALDSAGYTAMVNPRWGGDYPWSSMSYVRAAACGPALTVDGRKARPGARPWRLTWWSQMDYCCEDRIAADRETVAERMRRTAAMLKQNRLDACRLREEGISITDPVPVLQGRLPSDYRASLDALLQADGGAPPLLGLGSVCKRPLEGQDGVHAVLDSLSPHLPPGVQLHLYGQKGRAVEALLNHPAVASLDSCAWNYTARADIWRERRAWMRATGGSVQEATRAIPCKSVHVAAGMAEWHAEMERASNPSQQWLFQR